MDEKKVREAIDALSGLIGLMSAIDKSAIVHLKTAIEALEKQLPKKLIERHYEEEGEEPYIKMTCPNGCSFQLSRSSKYCRDCGQKLDWSE